jgi:UDP-2-acetamido-2,6-beta-L-arabino-hexul-4-ose reductase
MQTQKSDLMKVLITGSEGFIGKNMQLHLSERSDIEVVCFNRSHSIEELPAMLDGVGFVFHLAGINRPQDPAEFSTGNIDLTQVLCNALADQAQNAGNSIPLLLTSSIQADCGNPYGQSKLGAEEAVLAASKKYGFPAHVFRLPNMFGKWCKPNYNSAVATFCHNIARGLPIQIHDPAVPLTLVYVDDVVGCFIQLMDGANAACAVDGFQLVTPEYSSTVGEVADLIQSFKASRNTLVTERVGTGLTRALYSTYVSYLTVEDFAYSVPMHSDQRGVFVEMLKTQDSGQFSYFTVGPGITRGGHYHHSKTEKFLVIIGQARFKFRQMHTGESYELTTSVQKAEVLETVPGWTHDITNIGNDELVVMLWANEIFDRTKPDTFSCPL